MKLKINSSFTINNVTYKIKKILLFSIDGRNQKFYEGSFNFGLKKFWVISNKNNFFLYIKCSNNLKLDNSSLISTEKIFLKSYDSSSLEGTLYTYCSEGKIFKTFSFTNNKKLTFLVKEFNTSISKYINSNTGINWSYIISRLICFSILIFIVCFIIYINAYYDNDSYYYHSYYRSIRHDTTSGGVHFGK